jgi:hypothetical protein
LLRHQRPPRKPRWGLSSTSGTPCRPCKPSWTSGGSRRTRPKGRRRRNTSCQMTPRSATLSRYPRSQSSSRARRGLVVSTPTPYPNKTGTTNPKSSS